MSAVCNSTCSYQYQVDSLIPLLTSYSLTGTQLQMQLQNLQNFTVKNITVNFGDTSCANYTLSASFLLKCSLPQAGSSLPFVAAGNLPPQIHFTNLGYALVDPSITVTTLTLQILSAIPITVTNFFPNILLILFECIRVPRQVDLSSPSVDNTLVEIQRRSPT